MIKNRKSSEVIVPEFETVKVPMVCLIGASFDTGNLGVSALAWSSVKVIKAQWPQANIMMADVGRQPGRAQIRLDGHQESIATWPVRYCPDLFAAHHIAKLWMAICLCRLFPFLKRRWASNSSTLGAILRSDVVCDITGGDSFSDIYGMGRLFRGFLQKRLYQMTGKPFILLPQTYGPFKSCLARGMVRSVLSRASAIYSRDLEGLEQIRRLMGSRRMKSVPQLCPDVAFVLEPREPESSDDLLKIKNLKLRIQNCRFIGLNISGLLYNGGYTKNNQFDLACDYKRLVNDIICDFVQQENHYVLLVPHVIPDNMPVENDLDACKDVWQSLPKELQEKVIVVEGQYDQNEIKYIIGQCDFFLGARMHATIAALSQGIPAVGMAYSKKFAGVFETVGVEDCVVDMRKSDEQELLKQIRKIYESPNEIRQRLETAIPQVKRKVLSIFDKL